MDKFFVIKESNTFADELETIGLAKLIREVLRRIANDDNDVLIEDKGSYFELTSDHSISEEELNKVEYFDFFPYVTKKNEKSDLPNAIIYDKEKEIIENYYKLSSADKKKSENPPRPDFDIIRLYAGIDGYRKSFENLRLFKNDKHNAEESHFSKLLVYILKYYNALYENREKVLNDLNDYIKNNRIQIKSINALQDINPDKGKGINQLKTNSIALKGYSKMIWFRELLKFAGGWEGLVSRYFNKDYKTYVISPCSIYMDNFKNVFNNFKKKLKKSGSIKTDILLLLTLTVELINHHKNFKRSWDIFQPRNYISGFAFAYYKNLGQKPAVTNIGFLELSDFIKITNETDSKNWINILNEHVSIINNVDERNSSNIKMLLNYRYFLSSGNFDMFFAFYYDFATFLISSLSKKKNYVKPFTIKNLEVFMKSNESFEGIISNKGFQAIAKAIRNSTIVPVIHKQKKDVVFGLANRLKIASRTKESLISEISEFVQKYNENIMLKDFHEKQHQKYITTEELNEFYRLFDSDYAAKTIAGMLVAFGYAREEKEQK